MRGTQPPVTCGKIILHCYKERGVWEWKENGQVRGWIVVSSIIFKGCEIICFVTDHI
jgi:hypothetical protein